MTVCQECLGNRVPGGQLVMGADSYAGQQVHLLDTGPGHDQLAVHPVQPGFALRKIVAPIDQFGPTGPSFSSDQVRFTTTAAMVWCDTSEWQVPVNGSYPRPVFAYRLSLSTTKTDNNVHANHSWAEANSGAGKRLIGHIGYHVYYPGNWKSQVDFSLRTIGTWGPRFAWMLDVESWGGQITGNHSAEITAALIYAGQRLGNRARVCVYGNQGDLASIYPTRPSWVKVIVADYGGTPSIPHSGHQYTDGQYTYQGLPVATAPFGKCDHNVAWETAAQFVSAWFPAPPPAPKPVPKPTPKPAPQPAPKPVHALGDDFMLMVQPPVGAYPTKDKWPGIFMLANNTVKHIAHSPDVVTYRKAGIPGPIEISLEEFNGYPDVTKKV